MDRGQRFVLHALRAGAFQFKRSGYLLKSGVRSPYFFNSKMLNGGGDLETLTDLYAEAMGPELVSECDGVIGPPVAGTILASPVVMGIWRRYATTNSLRSYSYRTQPKAHGEGGVVTGGSLRHKKLVVIDDTFTIGTSLKECFNLINGYRGIPIACVVAFDRQQLGESGRARSQEFQEATGIPFIAIANMNDLIWGLKQPGLQIRNQHKVLEVIERYLQRHCCLGK